MDGASNEHAEASHSQPRSMATQQSWVCRQSLRSQVHPVLWSRRSSAGSQTFAWTAWSDRNLLVHPIRGNRQVWATGISVAYVVLHAHRVCRDYMKASGSHSSPHPGQLRARVNNEASKPCGRQERPTWRAHRSNSYGLFSFSGAPAHTNQGLATGRASGGAASAGRGGRRGRGGGRGHTGGTGGLHLITLQLFALCFISVSSGSGIQFLSAKFFAGL